MTARGMIDATLTDDARNTLIRALHSSAAVGVLHVTGGGSLILSDLLGVPGASGTILEATVPYAESAMRQLLGRHPDQACSAATARALATHAYQRGLELGAAEGVAFGLGVTASLATDRPKRGAHRAHVALQTQNATRTFNLTLAKGSRDRAGEERVVADLAHRALAHLVQGLGAHLPQQGALLHGDTLTEQHALASSNMRRLVGGSTDGHARLPDPVGAINAVFPGSFDPYHDGHRDMHAHAEAHLGTTVVLEVCVRNVDKPPLDYWSIARRRAQIGNLPLLLTTYPTFVEKARAFPGVTFVVGVDTMARIVDPKYYDARTGSLSQASQELAALGCRFLVYGRAHGDRFLVLEDLTLPPSIAAIAEGVAAGAFRRDISSSELRAGRASEDPTP